MKFKFYIIFVITILLFSNCNMFQFNGANYNYKYKTFNKRMDYDHKKYLLNPTNFGNSELKSGTNLEYVVQFFKEKLASNAIKNRDYKNKEGKLIIPFNMRYDLNNSQIDFLSAHTDLDYIILTKVMYLEELKKEPLDFKHKRRFHRSESGAKSFVKILDIKNNTTLIEMSCSGEVTVNETRNFDTGQLEVQRISIHKGSNSLGEKTMKKLLRKIK